MSKKHSHGQGELIPRSRKPMIPIDPSHQLVVLGDELNWDELLGLVEDIRAKRVRSSAGRPPHLRALVGALLLKATRDLTYREAEDLIRYYAPARYLCGLTETEWSPDHNTIHDFEVLLGEAGVRLVNEYVVKLALKEKLTFSSLAVGDTTAQEAAIPYPHETKLMAAFISSVLAASRGAGSALQRFARKSTAVFQEAAMKLREYRLFSKTKEKRLRVMGELMKLTQVIQEKLGSALHRASVGMGRLTKHRRIAHAKAVRLHETMKKLLPQIAYWLRTGFVAANKVVSVHIPEVYSVPRGKAGKDVEFGLTWGMTRLKGGFVLAHVAANRRELADARYVVRSVEECKRLFGIAPLAYAYDRAGHSEKNVATLRRLGVRHIGLAPRGRTAWEVDEATRRRLVSERVKVEGSIGTLKSRKYGFNRPRGRSSEMMGVCGQRAVLGMNLTKLASGLAERSGRILLTA